jgi:hypothetical protein
VEDAVRMAGGEAVKKYVTEAPKKGDIKKRKFTVGAQSMRERFVKKDGGKMIARKMDEDDDGKPIVKKKHKRSKIDDVLGDDTY